MSKVCRAQPLLGTFVEITAIGTTGCDCQAAVDAAFDAVALVHRLMSFHEPDSDVSRLNREAANRAVRVHPWTYRVLETAADLHRSSAGLFDVAVAPVLQAQGMLPEAAEFACQGRDGGGVELFPNHHVRFARRGVRIDLGGIAKGFAVDRAVAALRARRLAGGLVNAGGDVASFGPQSHMLHIRDPRDPACFIAEIGLKGEALASSGRCIDPLIMAAHAGSAVIDPRSGMPVTAIIGASVRASSCMLADALTKLVMISGESSAPLLDAFRASAFFVCADGRLCVTSDWREALGRAA